MHTFDYKDAPKKLMTAEINELLEALHKCRDGHSPVDNLGPKALTALTDVAKIQSVKTSNSLEGIYTSDERLESLVMGKTEPINRSEEEIAGYREVLATIHDNYEYIPVRPNTILQLHRDLYGFSSYGVGGNYKNSDNVIAETSPDGRQRVRFVPLPAFKTPEAMENLCAGFDKAMDEGDYDPLLLIAMFILDFLCIHPFNDGNGRISRLLTLLLLYRSGYRVGRYVSLEMLIEQSKREYYETLRQSSDKWNEGGNDYEPFVKYYLGIVLKAYDELEIRTGRLEGVSFTKAGRVKAVFDRKLGLIKKSDIAALCPDISKTTIERTIRSLLNDGYIYKVGSGRNTGYVKK